MFQQFLLLAT